MKILKQKSKAKKVILLLLCAILIAGVSYGVYAKMSDKWPFAATTRNNPTSKQDIDYSPPTNDQKSEGDRIKERSVDQTDGKTTSPPVTNQKKSTSIVITSASQNSGKFQVRFLIRALDEGTCTLHLTKGGSSVTKTSATQALPSSTTCQGFDIPLTELSQGEWTYAVTFAGKDYTGSASSKVTIQ